MWYVILLILAMIGLVGSVFLLYCCLIAVKIIDEEIDNPGKDNWKISDWY